MRSVWLHGWAADSRVFTGIINQLKQPVATSARLVDLPWTGSGDEPDRLPAYADAVLDAVSSIPAEETVTLVGWSLGAMVALEAASALAARVAGLVLISGCGRFVRQTANPHGQDPRVVRAMLQRLHHDPGRVVEQFLAGMFAPGEEEKRDRFIDNPGGEYRGFNPDRLARGLRYLLETDVESLLPAIPCPALVIHGDRDPVVDRRLGERLASSLPGGILHKIEGAGHAPFLDDNGQLAELIGDFIVSAGR
ncbi:MAG: alpha/beta fold hydrolase [Candidatus Glassbacteria bacterium]|nr:alpha/beta fold hydrolase [Candidatus Glassbacteria bacterium]